MINGLEGIPGSGKSYEAVAMHVLPALQSGRKVITNLPLLVAVFEAMNPDFVGLIELRLKSQPVLGIWDAKAIDDKGNGNAFKLADIRLFDEIQNVAVFGSVWDYYSEWKHPVSGIGPLFIVDEAHLALPDKNCNPEVIEFYKLHRHFNVDVLLGTQSFRDINQPIARLIAILIKVRKADVLGKKDAYIRKVHAGYRGAVISTEERKYRPEIFPLYRSHTQGNSVAESAASDVAPFLVRFNRFKWAWLLLTAVACVYAFWPSSKVKPSRNRVIDMGTVKPDWLPPPAGTMAVPSLPASAPAASAPVAPDGDPEPYSGKLLHLTGWATFKGRDVYTFAISAAGRRIGTLTSDELRQLGYAWKGVTPCAGRLTWNGKTTSVTCDPPFVAEGSDTRPVVVAIDSQGTQVASSKTTQKSP